MALVSGVVTVGTSPTLILKSAGNSEMLVLHNSSNAKIYIGGSNVSIVNGYHLSTTESLSLTLLPSNEIYGMVTSGTKDIAYFTQPL